MKTTRKKFIENFLIEMIFGTLFIALLIFYKKPVGIIEGMSIGTGSVLFLFSFLKRKELDERDYFLYYKVNHFTLASLILGIVLFRTLSYSLSLSVFVAATWAPMIMFIYFFFHGLFGLIFFLKK